MNSTSLGNTWHLQVIPPRKREAEGEATASQPSKARKTERIPAVPPQSPFHLPGTTRKLCFFTIYSHLFFGGGDGVVRRCFGFFWGE